MSEQCIYVIRSEGGPLKIGVAKNPKGRLASLQTASASKLHLSFVTDLTEDATAIESAAHHILRLKRLNGEWFAASVDEARQAISDAVRIVGDGKNHQEQTSIFHCQGSDFRNWRARLSLTQQEAANALGVTKRAVQMWEAGERPILRHIGLACAALEAGIPPAGSLAA